MKKIATYFALGCLAALPALAQGSRFTGFVGGGVSDPVGDLGTRLNTGWNATGGAGVNLNDHVGAMIDFMYNDFAINRTALNAVQAPDGHTRVWAFTLDPVIRLAPKESPLDVYVTGGGGVYHRTIEFTQPVLENVTGFDPWFGFYPATIVTNQVIGSFTVTKPGFNIGAGISFKLGSSNTKLFAEAKYHHMFTSGIDTTMLPVTVGLRW